MNQIETISTQELKAMAYDCLAIIEEYQRQLKTINVEIARRNQADLQVQPADTPVKNN